MTRYLLTEVASSRRHQRNHLLTLDRLSQKELQQELAFPPPFDQSLDFECAVEWRAFKSVSGKAKRGVN